MTKVVDSNRSTIFVKKSQKQAKTLHLDSKSVPMRILLKETQQDRILEKHK